MLYPYLLNSSQPSPSIDEINIPPVSNVQFEYVYNYYVPDERINQNYASDTTPLQNLPRYVHLQWTNPVARGKDNLSYQNLSRIGSLNAQASRAFPSIKSNADKIVSSDDFFNPGYVTHTFSSVNRLEDGAKHYKSYVDAARTTGLNSYGSDAMAFFDDKLPVTYDNGSPFWTAQMMDSFAKLQDMANLSSNGLRIYDATNSKETTDDDALIRSISNTSLSMRLSNAVVPDVFDANSEQDVAYTVDDIPIVMSTLADEYKKEGRTITSVKSTKGVSTTPDMTQFISLPVFMLGYAIQRYKVTPKGLVKDSNFYIDDDKLQTTHFEDRNVLFGVTYFYEIRTVAAVDILVFDQDDPKDPPTIDTVYVASDAVSVPVECYEYVPPPPPNHINFDWDYNNNNLIIKWEQPVNPQQDIVQYQVFRRGSLYESFELIAQYGFDNSATGPEGKRYMTGEKIDANNIDMIQPELRYLVTTTRNPVNNHVDNDFTLDLETLTSSDFIYAVCSIDAHGMISNYSRQYRVRFDPYANTLVVDIVCDEGCPKQYPNMKVNREIFKDSIFLSGVDTTQMNVYFVPDCLKVKDAVSEDKVHNVVAGQTTLNPNSHYLMQFINLDNQQMQLLRVNVKDTENLTSAAVISNPISVPTSNAIVGLQGPVNKGNVNVTA